MIARDVAKACGVGCTTVLEYGYRAKAANLEWPLPEGVTDEELEAYENQHFVGKCRCTISCVSPRRSEPMILLSVVVS